MAIDDNDALTPPAEESPKEKEDRQSKAKAFYRAMYAGGDTPDPETFGLDLGKAPAGQNDKGHQLAINNLENALRDAEGKASEWENSYKRLAADFENYRKRIDREREEFQAVGMQKALEAILPALDDLDMAQSKLTEKTEPKVMLDSLKMVCNRFGRCLEQVGIKQMQPIGEPFDPMYHEPVQEVPTNDVPDGCVAHQLRNGYMFRDKVLRPALVNVAVALTGEAAEAYEQAQAHKVAASAEVIDITPVAAAAVAEKAEEVMVPSSGTETSESLESIGNERSTQDIPFEEIKAAYEASLSANDASSQAGSETSKDDQAAQSAGTSKVYDLTDVEE
ncbi:MAG: molecular chaperone GrpE [Cyanobacteriota bacterium erpe_2018_sw_21hr_WHONDRS-SW48-000092_B_bin.40]|jgi:molecular chaperone GrpE|nr:molecular chaperone GrpE [Cyanobacteriota bacterium erpe_2018_sw_21hr_WHONDRS-SW48-000092_B_bin.40]